MRTKTNQFKLVLLLFLVSASLFSCKDDDGFKIDFPSRYLFAGTDGVEEYYTYERQNGVWNRVDNPTTTPDFSSLETSGYLDEIILDSDNELTYVDFSGSATRDYSRDGNTISIEVDSQPVEFEVVDENTIQYRAISLMDETSFSSAICGDYVACSASGADEFMFDPGWYEDGSQLYVVIYHEQFTKSE